MTPTLAKIWSLTNEQLPADWNDFFDPIGLILLGKLENYEYWCTPTNSITFATTGGDGVHYGLLDIGQGFNEQSPVVMTVPMCDTPNTIVGGNLLDFLALGCRQGYFSLEQLIYNREAEIAALDSEEYQEDMDDDEIKLVQSLIKEFKLKPWTDHQTKFKNLEDQFYSFIQAKSEPD